jgi:hypothetical protein
MVGGSLRVPRLLPPLKHVAMILLKVALNTKGPWEMIECKENLIEFKGYNIILIYH